MAGLSTAGAAGADDCTDRRHGEGQAATNNTFREFHADMANKYGDVAWKELRFVSNPDRKAVSALRSDTVRTGLWLACGKFFSCTANLWHRSALTSCACLQEVARILDETWALISDKADAIRLYGKNPIAGKGYNSEFRKVLSRKFLEVTSFSNALHLLQPAGSDYKLRVHLQPSQSPELCLSAMCPQIQAKKRKQKTEAAQTATPVVRRAGNAENVDPNVSATNVAAPNS